MNTAPHQPQRLIVDGQPVSFREGESVLLTLLRAGIHPVGGGCLCLAGDCPHCVAVVNGVAYIRTCQTKSRPGMIVERHPQVGYPALLRDDISIAPVGVRNLHCEVVVIGLGDAGRAEAEDAARRGKQVITLDASAGQEVIGVYPGPLVVARTDSGMLQVHPRREIIVATGAAEIQAVAPGSQLTGIVTARAAEKLHTAGIELGRVVAVGTPPEGVACEQVGDHIVRFEGTGRVRAVVVSDASGAEKRLECDTVSVSLGLHPRDALFRMGRTLNPPTPAGPVIRVVGRAAQASDIPPCPRAGTVCSCSAVTVDDLQLVWEHGFHELEMVKRATLAGTGTCQGSVCLPHIRSFLAGRGEELQPPFTARPLTRQATIAEAAAGAHHTSTPRTALHDEHLRMGAVMERIGGWWRPWHYGIPEAEYWAVREAVSLGDVSTLGKVQVSGPDALEFLERLYPTKVSTIKPGRCRYVLLLDDRGYVIDDGMICRDTETRFTLTFTTGGSTHAEMWVRDWAEQWKMDVRILNRTMSLGAINVTGPLARELLRRAGCEDLPEYLVQRRGQVAGVDCRIFRLSFTGELSYELHHLGGDSVALWRGLMHAGADLGVKPHGLDVLLRLRLEKGHLLVGQDTDFDSTPRRLGHEWAVKLDKPEFVGKQALLRTNKIPLDRKLVGLETDGPTPKEGAVLWKEKEHAGYVTSSAYSPALGKSVMLAWLKLLAGDLPREVTIHGHTARRVSTPFYDPEGQRARA